MLPDFKQELINLSSRGKMRFFTRFWLHRWPRRRVALV